MSDIFISYARESRPLVETLADDLKALGHTVWFDGELRGGQSWWDQILERVRSCDVFLFVLTPPAMDSMACTCEYEYADSLGKSILPVLLADGVSVALLPGALSKIQFVDYRNPNKAAAFKIYTALNSLPPSTPLPDPLPAPPKVPLSYIESLARRVSAHALSCEEQIEIVADLKNSIRNPSTADDAMKLLHIFEQREDLFTETDDEIDRLLGRATGGETPSAPIFWLRSVVGFILGVTLLLVTIAFIQWYNQRLAPLADVPVAVLLPSVEGSVADNANRQLEGFEQAFSDHEVEAQDRHIHHFEYPFVPNGEPRDQVMNQIIEWYEEGIRTFVMTMSGAVFNIKDDFIEWVETLPENDRPVLVATVAGASNIADLDNGIIRFYIRSKDESHILSKHIQSLEPVEVAIFYINDSYGHATHDLFLESLGSYDTRVRSFPVEITNSKFAQKHILASFLEKSNNLKDTVVLVVGYGPMIQNIIQGLEEFTGPNGEKFEGKIVVPSALTEKMWQPTLDSTFLNRIRTIGPVVSIMESDSTKRGVVFQFSYLTLDRALQCKTARGIEAFWNCWTNVESSLKGEGWVDVEFTPDGDSIVSLRLLNQDQW